MNNVVEFYVKMRDMMSGGLVKLAQTSKQTFSKIQNDTKQTQTTAERYRQSLGYLYDKMNDLKKFRMDEALGKKHIMATTKEVKNLQYEIDKLEGKASGGGGLFKKLAPYISAAAIFGGAMAFGKASIAQYADFEKSTRTYQVMTGNKGIGTSLSGELNNLKQNSILGTAVYPNAQMLMAMGDTADKVIPHLKMLGDVSMGDADKLGRLTYAFGEVESAGKLNGRQLLQFINAGFNPLNEISKKTGKNMETLRHEMAKGKITFAEVEQAFESVTGKGGRFNDMMNQMADTTSGKTLMLKGKIAALEIAVGERLAPAFKNATDGAIGLVEWLKHLIEIPVEVKTQNEIDKIRTLYTELNSSNTSHQRQVDILKELEQINPNIVKGIDDQNIAYDKLAKNVNAVTGALRNKIIVETFDKNSGMLLTKYKEAEQTLSDTDTKTKAMAFAALPDAIANDPTLSTGQKQMMGSALLANHAKKGMKPTPYMRRLGIENDYTKFEEYKYLVDQNREAQKFTDENFAEYKSATGKINALQKSIDGVLGVGSMTAAQIKPGGKGAGGGGDEESTGGKDVAKGITGGGPRVININGVKFTDKIEIHANTMNEGFEEAERKLEEMFLRVLNSGASVQ